MPIKVRLITYKVSGLGRPRQANRPCQSEHCDKADDAGDQQSGILVHAEQEGGAYATEQAPQGRY
jgi:hypothetical protein